MSRPTVAADLIWGALAGAAAVWTMGQIDQLIAKQERQPALRPPTPRLDYSLAAISTAAFTVLRTRVPYIGAARGIPFGAAMFVLEDEVLNPKKHRLASNPTHAHATGLLTHAGFGLMVDTLLRAVRGR